MLEGGRGYLWKRSSQSRSTQPAPETPPSVRRLKTWFGVRSASLRRTGQATCFKGFARKWKGLVQAGGPGGRPTVPSEASPRALCPNQGPPLGFLGGGPSPVPSGKDPECSRGVRGTSGSGTPNPGGPQVGPGPMTPPLRLGIVSPVSGRGRAGFGHWKKSDRPGGVGVKKTHSRKFHPGLENPRQLSTTSQF